MIVHILLEWAERALDWFPDGRRLALVTWRPDAIPADVVAALNQYEGVIVPSSFNLAVFRHSGVTTPITVVPHALPAAPQAPGPLPEVDDHRFLFYLIAPGAPASACRRPSERSATRSALRTRWRC